MAKPTGTDESLMRLGGGRWQTRDERFTIEPQSGTWVVVDAEQTDELGLALVRGPFGSLGAAKEAIAGARDGKPAESPLSARAAKLRDRPGDGAKDDDRARKRSSSSAPTSPGTATRSEPARTGRGAKPEAPTEPRWIQALEPSERRNAKGLIHRLTEAGAPDPEGMARRDIVGGVPATAAFAIAQAITSLGADADPAKVARLLTDGRDGDLGVRWRLVDGDDRPITLDLDAPGRR